MGKMSCEYDIEGERYRVEARAGPWLGRVTVSINGEKFVLRSSPFRIKRCEPFMIGQKRCMLTVSSWGKISIE